MEVKSERDTLARRQRLWLSTLRGAGAEAEAGALKESHHISSIYQRIGVIAKSGHGILKFVDHFSR